MMTILRYPVARELERVFVDCWDSVGLPAIDQLIYTASLVEQGAQFSVRCRNGETFAKAMPQGAVVADVIKWIRELKIQRDKSWPNRELDL
jgi:hypothetical protein